MVEFDFVKAILTDNPSIFLHCKTIVLTEKQTHVKGKESVEQRITIDEADIDEIEVYKFANKDGEIDFPFFKKGEFAPKLLRKFCDYIIICTCRQKFFVVLIELKAPKTRNLTDKFNEAKDQLDATETFISYILNTFERIKNETTNKRQFVGIEKCIMKLDKIIKKCVFLSDINNPTNTNPHESTIGDNVNNCDGYYRCDLAVIDIFQLKSILQKKKTK